MDFRFVYIVAVLGFVQCELLDMDCNATRKFVKGHNLKRWQLAQGAVPGHAPVSNMNAIVWDQELAAKAAKWASKNKYEHNPDRKIDSDRFVTGENIYRYGTTNYDYVLDLEIPMKSWWDEYKNFTYKKLEYTDFTEGPEIGHFTQMAWAETTYLGCAVSQYSEEKWNTFLVVCNYGPAGNIIGKTPYTISNKS